MNLNSKSNDYKKIIFITGDCGVGKSSILPLLKKHLDPKNYLIHDMDEKGSPELTLEWRKKTTNYWIKYALNNVSVKNTPIILGMIDPRDVEGNIRKTDINFFFFIHLDVSKEERLKRLYKRGETRKVLMNHHKNLINLRSWFKITPFSHKTIDTTNLTSKMVANKVNLIVLSIVHESN